ncbi:hypothetical protein [endosymbiont of Riftia pachyptila]|uniref:hypothetical protein n=1 Tax=endosymbiont of Riftia pachyptila TaxID=54396 RepID=UPI00058692C9|nr:hypothetical protein [endosymbiont of Riftia pachyptila]
MDISASPKRAGAGQRECDAADEQQPQSLWFINIDAANVDAGGGQLKAISITQHHILRPDQGQSSAHGCEVERGQGEAGAL